MLKQVITSWQVIAVTIVLVLYLYIVFYAARSYRRPRAKKEKIKRHKIKKADLPTAPKDSESAENTNDELGLEEA